MIRVSREKQYPVPGRTARFGWRWSYQVKFDNGEPPARCGDMSEVRGVTKRALAAGATGPIVREWETIK